MMTEDGPPLKGVWVGGGAKGPHQYHYDIASSNRIMEYMCECMCVCVCENGYKWFSFSGSLWVFPKSVLPSEGLVQGQATASALLNAAIGFKQHPFHSVLPRPVIGFSGPESVSNTQVKF